MRTLLLVDNGSSRPQATLKLRRLALRLAQRLQEPVHPVSLLHADRVDAARLDGRPADTFEPFLRAKLDKGAREFGVIPLFFGASRALTDFIPAQIAALEDRFGTFSLRLAEALCPLPLGEPVLTEILLDQLRETARLRGIDLRRIVLVDHGSPLPAVTAVRRHLAQTLLERLDCGTDLSEAVMERREGSEYDFNGPLLADQLEALATRQPRSPILLSMLFLLPGRHAGPGGDIEDIVRSVQARHPGLQVYPTALVADHPALIDILEQRANALSHSGRQRMVAS